MAAFPVRRAPTGLSRILWTLYEWPVFYGMLVVLGAIQLVWSVIAFAIRHVVPERTGRDIGRRFVSLLYRCCFRVTGWLGMMHVDASALDAIDTDEAMIIAPNHPSVFDALILISRLEKLNCIMKASVLDNVLLGAGAKLAGYIRNDGPRRMLRLSSADLQQGGQLIIFPEGTRTVVAPVNDFKCGFAAMARSARVPIQTVIIETDTPYMSKGWSILTMPPHLPMRFRVRLGRRFEVDGDVNAFVRSLRDYFVEELADAELGDLWTARPDVAPEPSIAPPSNPSPMGLEPRRSVFDGSPASLIAVDAASSTHLVLVPSYNAGDNLCRTVAAARRHWAPVWVVVDGSDDGSAASASAMAANDPDVRVLVLPANRGKGAAVLHGLQVARDAGYTHALTMDSDGQHPVERIGDFMRASAARPDAMILGKPVFAADAPALRVKGRRVSNWWARLETLCFDERRGIADSLFGFRVYPIAPLIAVMERTRWMRRFDFDPEAVVRLAWRGVPPVNVDAEVRYLAAAEGGVSHFRYGRDNVLLSWMHVRLMTGFVLRLPSLVARRLTR